MKLLLTIFHYVNFVMAFLNFLAIPVAYTSNDPDVHVWYYVFFCAFFTVVSIAAKVILKEEFSNGISDKK